MKRAKRVSTSLQRKYHKLQNMINYSEDRFCTVIDDTIPKIEQEYKNVCNCIISDEKKIIGKESDEDGRYYDPNLPNAPLYGISDTDMSMLYSERNILEEQLLALATMKIVYLYKEFEILIKELINNVLPEVEKKSLHKWDNIKKELKKIGILCGHISDFESVNNLRLVNNSIKHALKISMEVKNNYIPEFRDKIDFDFDSIVKFHSRVKDKPKIFLFDLVKKLYEYLEDQYHNKKSRIN